MQSRGATMRTSDAERQRAADFLRDACADGRLSPAELEERLELLFAGSTVEDIAVLVRDLPGGAKVVPRLQRGAVPRGIAPAPLPARRRRRAVSPAVPVGAGLVVLGAVWLALGALPPLMAIIVGTILIAMLIPVLLFAVAMAPVGLAVFGFAWLMQRVLRGPRAFGPPGAWGDHGQRRRRPFV